MSTYVLVHGAWPDRHAPVAADGSAVADLRMRQGFRDQRHAMHHRVSARQ